jgi:hypothetical protein
MAGPTLGRPEVDDVVELTEANDTFLGFLGLFGVVVCVEVLESGVTDADALDGAAVAGTLGPTESAGVPGVVAFCETGLKESAVAVPEFPVCVVGSTPVSA